MATLRELKGRIGSVHSSEKITGAMKMISSAKMHKAEQTLRRLLPFRTQIQTIMGNLLSADAEFTSPLLETRAVQSVGIVILGSDDGLCGAYNINLLKGLISHIAECRRKYGENVGITIFPVGGKMLKAVRKISASSVRVEPLAGVSAKSTPDQVKAFSAAVQERFLDGRVDAVDIVYMSYKSVSRQRLAVERLLPVAQETIADNAATAQCRPYIFEPGPDAIFSSVLPLFVLSVVQTVFTENMASEQAARVIAMQAANDNAKKLLGQLQLEYNKLRQQAITSELLDILGGQVK